MSVSAVTASSPPPIVDRLAKLANENVALRKACKHARVDLQAVIPIVESVLPCPAAGLRQTLGLIDKALAVRA